MTQPFENSASAKVIPLNSGADTPALPVQAPAPFQAQTPPPLVPVSTHPAPNPHDLLGEMDRKMRRAIPDDRKRMFAYVAGGLLGWQIMMPFEITPMGMIGAMTGEMRGDSSSRAAVAQQVAQLETELAAVKGRFEEAKGNCMYADMIGMGGQCRSLVEQRFEGQILGLESQIDALRPKTLGEKLREFLGSIF